MKIIVCIKQVPDTAEVKINPETNNLVREGVPSIMNPYDLCALKEALKIKAEIGAFVTAVSMGPLQAQSVLEEALVFGADEAVLLTGKEFAGADTLATGYALSEFLRTLKPDIVLCGNEAIDGCTGQVGPIIAENLEWPQITYVSSFEVKDGVILAEKETWDSYYSMQTSIPAVICVLKKDGILTDKGYEAFDKEKIRVVSGDSLKLDPSRIGTAGSPTRVKSISVNNSRPQHYVEIDSTLPAEDRIRMIINGGIIPKRINLMRGSKKELAQTIFADEDFQKFL